MTTLEVLLLLVIVALFATWPRQRKMIVAQEEKTLHVVTHTRFGADWVYSPDRLIETLDYVMKVAEDGYFVKVISRWEGARQQGVKITLSKTARVTAAGGDSVQKAA